MNVRIWSFAFWTRKAKYGPREGNGDVGVCCGAGVSDGLLGIAGGVGVAVELGRAVAGEADGVEAGAAGLQAESIITMSDSPMDREENLIIYFGRPFSESNFPENTLDRIRQ
jgi:hypothetical protein